MTQNSALYVEAGETVAIYFDSPEHCYPNATGAVTQMDLQSNTRITSTSGTPSNLGLLFVGSTDPLRESTILLSSNTAAGTTCQQNYVIYAPLSHIELNSNSTYCGALGARTLHLDSNADLRPPSNLVDFRLPPLKPHYGTKNFIECSVATGNTPTAGC
jgi:hypothetical protein